MKPLSPFSLKERWPVLALALTGFCSLLVILGLKLYNQPRLVVGTTAPATLYAPMDTQVVDQEATTIARENARQQSIQIFQSLEDRNERVLSRLGNLLQEGDRLFMSLGPFPYLNPALISTTNQQRLRTLPAPLWRNLKAQRLTELDPDLANAWTTFFNSHPQAVVTNTLTRTAQARQRYETSLKLLASVPTAYQQALTLTPLQWQQVRAESLRVAQTRLAVGIIPGLPEEFMLRGLNALIDPTLKGASRELVLNLLGAVLEPNLKVDRFASLMAADTEAQSISPVTIPIRKNQLLVQGGQQITPRLFTILDQQQLTDRGVNWGGLGTLAGLLLLGLLAFAWGQHTPLPLKDQAVLLLLASVTTSTGVLLPSVQLLPLALLGLLAGNYYGSRIGVLTMLCLAPGLFYGWSLAHPSLDLVPIFIGGLVAAVLVDRVRSRSQIALAGLGVALAQSLSYLAVTGLVEGLGWQADLLPCLLYAGGGLTWSIVALGISPSVEAIFDVVTPVRLAELSNPNCGLLKRLVVEAPGTYQHTLFVANLATAAAQALGDNADLVRVGTLYHDIGKMKRPQYFIENQMGLPNPHDQIDDPWRSAQIIRDHVNDGLNLARKYKLPKVIQDFIPEHQGTILIAYFYHEARKFGEVKEVDFRYQGPIPQSRETGLVMLADACEAALRSLNNVGRTDPVQMVRRILQARWDENQLVESGLREEELDLIACTFIKVWRETNHRRIRYPNPPELRRRNLAAQNT